MKHVGRVAGANGDRTQGQGTQPRPRAVWGWIALALSSLWPLAVAALLLAGPGEPDEISGGLGAGLVLVPVLGGLAILAGLGVAVGCFALGRGEQPKAPARLGILLGSVPAALFLLLLLLRFFG